MTTESPMALGGTRIEDQGTLRVGQTVHLTERTFGCQVTILAEGRTGHQVAEVRADHIWLYDPATDTHAPP
jgi:hypothetical protein